MLVRSRWISLVLLFQFLLLGSCPAAAAPDPIALLVVVPEGTPLDAPEVERWMDLLKRERDRQRLSSDQLPLLRLSMGRAQHRAVLGGLGLKPASQLRTLTCRRGANGWPSALLFEHESASSPDAILARVARQLQGGDVVASDVGLLLVTDGAASPVVKSFLEELGRYWLQRYGRVRPAPYPLASYDVSRSEVSEALDRAFPQLTEGGYPVAALCTFVSGRPTEVLRIYHELETPASTVREISAARGLVLEGGARSAASAGGAGLPGASELALSMDQERVLLISRLNETAQQLWNGAKDDKTLKNQGPKRLLIAVIEDSRRYLSGDPASLESLHEGLRDYLVEPLSSNSEQATRLLELARALLEL